jgi:hypothetical protein
MELTKMFENRYCPICKAEVTLRYHVEDKHFRLEKGKIVRDDANQRGFLDTPELLFECSNDREHEIPNYPKWEDPVRKGFYKGAYYDR